MGVGKPDDILGGIERGIDMFDCVHPTRAGRHGHAYTRFGVINLKNARHKDDPRPLDEDSPNPNCRRFSRAYLHHLVRTEEILGAMILSQINLAYYQELVQGARAAIEAARFDDYAAANARRLGARRPAATSKGTDRWPSRTASRSSTR